MIRARTTNFPGRVEVEVGNQLWVPDCPPDFAPMDHTRIWIQANVKEKTVVLELVVQAETPHLIWANSQKRLLLDLDRFVPPNLNGIWLTLSEIR